ncbi:MAG: ArnT family glycosyltransferase [Crocinitomicaceae bacterium]
MDKVYDYIQKNKWIEWLLFAICFWLVIVHLHLNRGLGDMIPGYHYWRKTDTYAQILNYYYNGFNLFDHGIYFNQMESGGKAVAEFPLFYYLNALQLKIFGNHLIVLKINWLIVMFAGQFALYKIALHFVKNHMLALTVPLVLFLSPTYVIYTLEFLPDPIALHLGFVGLYFILKYHQSNKRKLLISALIFVTISGMMKPFFLIPFIAYLIVLSVNTAIKKEGFKQLLPLLLPFVFVGIWFLYMNWYNNKHGSHYFLSKLKPIWTDKDPNSIWEKMQNKWLSTYFHPTYLNILAVLLVVGLAWGAWKNRIMAAFVLLAFLGATTYFLLLFGMLKQHDYYIFPVLFVAPVVVLIFWKLFSDSVSNNIVQYTLGLITIAFIYTSMHFSWFERQRRLKSKPINATHTFRPYQNLEPFLLRNGVQKNDLVIAFSDKSPSYALMLMNRRGWSGFQTMSRREKVTDLMDLGAQYIVVNQSLPPKRDSVSLEGVTLNYIADTNNVFIYKLTK